MTNDIDDLESLFEYQLTGAYYVERQLADALEELAVDATNDTLKKGFKRHCEETREHVRRLESVFDAMGWTPEAREVPSVDGLVEEKREFDSLTDEGNVRDLFYLSAAMKAEQLEITAYDSLQTLASKMNLGDEVTGPLGRNKREEEKTLGELKAIAEGSKVKSLLDDLL